MPLCLEPGPATSLQPDDAASLALPSQVLALPPSSPVAEGVKAEDEYAKNGTLPDPSSTDNPEFKIVLGLIRDGLKGDPLK